jgi:tetraacyldisaccharide 4'-kinase
VGVLRTRTLEWPVVSVGSLSAGGAGKTPVVIALAELLRERGWEVDVLSRGYGRNGSGVERVDAGAEGAAARFGDEPVAMAQRLRVPVWVGVDRFAAGQAAEAAAGEQTADSSAALRNDKQGALRNEKQGALGNDEQEALRNDKQEALENDEQEALRNDKQGGLRNDNRKWVHLLDDGFQHRRLARAMDVVVVTAEDLQDALLPAGNRREALRALRLADAVVVREEERDRVTERVRQLMRADAPVWRLRRELRLADSPAELGARPRPLAFCGIARPEGFWWMLAQAGYMLAGKVAYSDHHRYGADDVERLAKVAAQRGATGFLTTEKDAVKLSAGMMERLRSVGPVCVVALDAGFVDEAEVVRELEARCR